MAALVLYELAELSTEELLAVAVAEGPRVAQDLVGAVATMTTAYESAKGYYKQAQDMVKQGTELRDQAVELYKDTFGSKQVGEKRPPSPTDDEQSLHSFRQKKIGVDRHVMSGLTSYPSTHCCVNLGNLNITKGLKRSPKIKAINLHAAKHVMRNVNQVVTSTRGKTTFTVLNASIYDTFPPTPSTLAASPGFTINGVPTMQWIENGPGGTTLLEDALSKPAYGGSGVGVTDANDAGRGLILSKQYIEWKFKNLSGADSEEGDQPIFVSVYALQLKEHVYAKVTSNTLAEVPLIAEIAEGFVERYDTSGPFINGPTRSIGQDYGYNIHDNSYIKKCCEMLDSKKFCLQVGQEGTLRVYVNKGQWNNFQYLNEAETYGAGSGNYKPVAHRPGEIFFLIKVHGGLVAGQADEGAGFTAYDAADIGSCTLGIHILQRFTFKEALRSVHSEKIATTAKVNMDIVQDIDIDETFEV